ncbi:protein-glutamate O-methyltransferase CheR [Nitrospira lenta]|uniref:CheR family methyltransferase n=1 Tax=Nitrospira lenta TaxID=1436998 RepID=UPI00319E32D9
MSASNASTGEIAISDQEFADFQKFVHHSAGITLSAAKKALVSGRLLKRLRHYQLASYREYFQLIMNGQEPAELQTALDLLTTNETYFFREPKHFEYLRTTILPARKPGEAFRIWSAACSSGEEPYTLAMVLADSLGTTPWNILASDISSRVLAAAQTGQYNMERAEKIPQAYLKAYCLKGVEEQAGTFLIDPKLRSRIRFLSVNLNASLPETGTFDVIFLRNVMIYFNAETKRQVVDRLLSVLKPGGYFIISHSESLHGITDHLKMVRSSIYRKA